MRNHNSYENYSRRKKKSWKNPGLTGFEQMASATPHIAIGQGIESRSSLNIFQAFLFAAA